MPFISSVDGTKEKKQVFIDIKKADDEQMLIFGEVYAPMVPDSQGDFMDAEGIQNMAHNFIASLRARKVDVSHDNEPTKAVVVESFIARKGDDIYIPGAWVVGISLKEESGIFEKVKSGELNGFSMEAMVIQVEQDVILEIPSVVRGTTLKAEDHSHKFIVRFSNKGEFIGGMAKKLKGHEHRILRGTATEVTNSHSHRFSFLDEMSNANSQVTPEESE